LIAATAAFAGFLPAALLASHSFDHARKTGRKKRGQAVSEDDLSPALARAEVYETFMGRWSRHCGLGFLAWLGLPPRLRWIDIGCGTGALTDCILKDCAPVEIVGIDPAADHVEYAKKTKPSDRVRFEVGNGCALPFADDVFDVAVSGLVLNFIPDRAAAVAEMRRVVRPGGVVAAYLWDFAGSNELAQHIGAALALTDPGAAERAGELVGAASTSPGALTALFAAAGLGQIEIHPIEIDAAFVDFDEYWASNTTFPSPVARHVAGLSGEALAHFRATLHGLLPRGGDGRIQFRARAWAVRGRWAE
jgi:SAM-dependent methyltransferase